MEAKVAERSALLVVNSAELQGLNISGAEFLDLEYTNLPADYIVIACSTCFVRGTHATHA